jgi:branched-chain amino acid transport system permease protein
VRARRAPGGWLAGSLVCLVLVVVPPLVGSAQLSLPTDILLFALVAITYDLIFGIAGLISFGHALFMGAGAYALAVSLTTYHLSLAVALLAAGVTGLLLALVTGLLALRTRGVYFAMVTLAFAQAAYTLAESNVGNLTGGDNGLLVSGAPGWLVDPGSEAHLYYLVLAALVAGYLFVHRLVRAPVGRVWLAIRENEQRVKMLGYPPYSYKLVCYTISGTLASLAGGLYALAVGDVSTSLLTASSTIEILLMVIIGGSGSLWGAAVGALLVRSLDHYLNVLSTSSFVTSGPGWLQSVIGQPLLLFGIIYLLLVYFFPNGISGLFGGLPAGGGTRRRPGGGVGRRSPHGGAPGAVAAVPAGYDDTSENLQQVE